MPSPGSPGSPGDSGNADAGEFPAGEFPGESGGDTGDSETASAAGEPGFEDSSGEQAGGDGGMPDMRDEPTLEDSMGAFEDAMGEPAQGSSTAAGGMPGSMPGGMPGGMPGDGQQPGGQPPGGGSGAYSIPGMPGGSGDETGQGSGGGTLTPGEQVAILDGQLERGTGEFDAMILEEQAAQRRAERAEAANRAPIPESASAGAGGESEYGDMAEAGGYGEGGGMPGEGSPGGGIGGGGVPSDTARYPAPEDIPAGSDDDVVARQLREAAMREPDPAIREKLWDEYRKYKGIDS
jgi:hypothetical protein